METKDRSKNNNSGKDATQGRQNERAGQANEIKRQRDGLKQETRSKYTRQRRINNG
jgi:hypothetical protein